MYFSKESISNHKLSEHETDSSLKEAVFYPDTPVASAGTHDQGEIAATDRRRYNILFFNS